MLLGKAKRCGIECGTASSKLALLSREKGELYLEGVFVEEEPFGFRIDGSGRSPEDVLRGLLSQADIVGSRAVLAINNAVESCFLILPQVAPSDAEGAIRLQARKMLSWKEDDPLVSHVETDYLAGRFGSYVALAEWGDIVPYCRMVEGSGADVDSVTVRGCAYHALAVHQGWFRANSCVMVVDVGAVATCVHVLDASGILFSREIAVAGDALTKTLTTEITVADGIVHLDPSEAEEAKISGHLVRHDGQHPKGQASQGPSSGDQAGVVSSGAGTGADIHMEAMMRPTVERISSELLRSIKYFKDNAGRDVECVYLTGGGSEQKHLSGFLEKSIPVPVKRIDPFEGMSFASEKVKQRARKWQSRFSVAVGLALLSEPSILLLSKGARMSRRLARYANIAVAAILLLGFIPALAGGVFSAVRLRMLSSRNDFLRDEIARENAQLNEAGALRMKKEQAEQRLALLGQAVAPGPIWAGVLNALAAAVPEGVILTDAFSQSDHEGGRKFVVRGEVSRAAGTFDTATSSFASSLNESIFFSDVRISMAEAKRGGNSLGKFEIQCKLVYGGK